MGRLSWGLGRKCILMSGMDLGSEPNPQPTGKQLFLKYKHEPCGRVNRLNPLTYAFWGVPLGQNGGM
jgi:hypothetical protein